MLDLMCLCICWSRQCLAESALHCVQHPFAFPSFPQPSPSYIGSICNVCRNGVALLGTHCPVGMMMLWYISIEH